MAPLELYLLTFNCARNLIDPALLGPALFDALPSRQLPDILAISLQEIAPLGYAFLGGTFIAPFLERVRQSVDVAVTRHAAAEQAPSSGYELFAARSIGLTSLMLFMKPDVANRLAGVQTAGVGVGLWEMGNKGAVGIRIALREGSQGDSVTELTFVSAHFAPYEDGTEKRNQDWEAVVRKLVFTDDITLFDGEKLSRQAHARNRRYQQEEEEPLLASGEGEQTGLFKPGNFVFFAGDLNYRTSNTSPGTTTYQLYPRSDAAEGSAQHFKQWLKKDQLTTEKAAQRTLHGFHELPIEFLPTYKYAATKTSAHTITPEDNDSSVHRETWTWAPHRYPSWCDRILFVPVQGLKPHVYTALPVQATSDHRPVALSVSVDGQGPRVPTKDDILSNPPFSLSASWKTDRAAARRKEILVGICAYLTLTRDGNIVLFGATAGIVSIWLLLKSI